MHKNKQLNEGLKKEDLKGFVTDIFTVDTYKSKMGEDRDVAVLAFRVKDRLPALDLMEFLERGYDFILDADISSGEESDGRYSVFVEMERNKRLPKRIAEMLEDISSLTGIDMDQWRYRYYKDWKSKSFNVESITEDVPLDPDAYDNFLQESRLNSVKKFLVNSAVEQVTLEGTRLTFNRPFAGSMTFEVKDIGDYKKVMERNNGPLKLDEQSVSETVFLGKLFGDFEVVKIADSFMVKNNEGDAIVLKQII